MKKLALIFVLVLMVTSLAMAQSYVPTVDVFGAHLNGGRGCAACHAPHGGGRSSGTYNTASTANMGDSALWGTDTSAIVSKGTFSFSGFPVTIAAANWSDPQYKHIATCLSCHDGDVAKGAMMSGVSWEQQQNMLPYTAANLAIPTYGPNPIPTLLGQDGGTAGDYANDHPVGPAANLGAVFADAVAQGLTVTGKGGTSTSINTVVIDANLNYGKFVANYGYPAIRALRFPAGATDGAQAYLVCTTCHQQHNMVVYDTSARNASPIAGGSGTFQTYFFVKGPYNPGAAFSKTKAPSTMQFCRQCHFSMSNERYGLYTVTTAF